MQFILEIDIQETEIPKLKSALDHFCYSNSIQWPVLKQCGVSGALPLTKDPFEFIADSMEKELRLRQMIDKWCIDQLGNTDAALEKAETMFVAARDTFYRQ